MRREVSLEEISDGRLYELNDMVKADCQDCAGCHDCCEGMGDSVVLDPMDVYRLCTNLGKTPQELVSAGLIQFDAMDGNILPHLCMSGKKQCCVFLNEQGRCSIHDFRPGFCRLFPLGRVDDHDYGSWRYCYFLLYFPVVQQQFPHEKKTKGTGTLQHSRFGKEAYQQGYDAGESV